MTSGYRAGYETSKAPPPMTPDREEALRLAREVQADKPWTPAYPYTKIAPLAASVLALAADLETAERELELRASAGIWKEATRRADNAERERDEARKLLAEVAEGKQARDLATAREALRGLLASHVRLVESGDCGSWDPEKEPEVLAARAALDGEET